MSKHKMIAAMLSVTLTIGMIQSANHVLPSFPAAAEDQPAETTASETVLHLENPFNKQDDAEVPYDRTRWVQPPEWNCPRIDPKDYDGGIMVYFDKLGLEPENSHGKVQRIYCSVTDAAEPINCLKFHIFYDTRLTLQPDRNGDVVTPGKAVSNFTTGSAMLEEGQLAYYAYSSDDIALGSGSLFTLDFIIPENAQPGDFYPIGIAYVDDGIAYDTFLNSAKDDAGKLQMTYVFTKGIYNGFIKMLGEKPTTAATTAPFTALNGDYNNDHTLSVADAVLLARFLAENNELTDDQIAAILNHDPDFDSDGFVNVFDVVELLTFLQSYAAQ